MNKSLPITDRLIVAADFKPDDSGTQGRKWVSGQVRSLARCLKGMDVYLKVNSALRACGYDLIDEIHDLGLKVFADLKLIDIKETLTIDGMFLWEARPELVTAMCCAGAPALCALNKESPYTEVLGVTVLTSLTDADTHAMFSCSSADAVVRFARVGQEAGVGGLITSAKEIEVIRSAGVGLLMSMNTPAIRPAWWVVPGDDQDPSKIMTPKKATIAGADRMVVGRPITQHKNPREAVQMILDEIEEAVELLEIRQGLGGTL
jgi:orotidine-5'-phosphate decarboxylase